mmetsp:Transcript_34412/g.60321  ORF Transcript_34412/g.60321 Transcript_34412/m.60321 type:complete len:445 (+) Transcript_34412:29-1363(+)
MKSFLLTFLLSLVCFGHATTVQLQHTSISRFAGSNPEDQILMLLQEDSYSQLSGDTTDNDETDSEELVLVSPDSETEQVSWVNDIYDGDESEYQEDVDESDNPAVSETSFLQVIDNPLDRDEDDLPDDVDDSEDDAVDGDFFWLLVGAFTDDESGQGKVYAIPQDDEEDDQFVLISGLDKPVGICFDQNHDFLYVVDPTYGDQGFIYQFSIDWDEDDKFELATTDYVVVYEGANPYSCWIDQYGNLYFVDATENQINLINYLDLWSGYTNYFYTLYSNDDSNNYINTPVGINVYDSEDLYFVNHKPDEDAYTLMKADANVKDNNSGEYKQKALTKEGAWAVAVSDDYIYFTTKDGVLWVMDKEDKTELTTKDSKYLESPRGVCYGDDDIYVADFARGLVNKYDDDDDVEDDSDTFVEIEGAYAVYCVNSAVSFAVSLAMLLLVN